MYILYTICFCLYEERVLMLYSCQYVHEQLRDIHVQSLATAIL